MILILPARMGAVGDLVSFPQAAGDEPTCSLGRDGGPITYSDMRVSVETSRGFHFLWPCAQSCFRPYSHIQTVQREAEPPCRAPSAAGCISPRAWSACGQPRPHRGLHGGPHWPMNQGGPQSCIQCSHFGWTTLLRPQSSHHYQLCRKWFFSLFPPLQSHIDT